MRARRIDRVAAGFRSAASGRPGTRAKIVERDAHSA
jgi:hypothetical protein